MFSPKKPEKRVEKKLVSVRAVNMYSWSGAPRTLTFLFKNWHFSSKIGIYSVFLTKSTRVPMTTRWLAKGLANPVEGDRQMASHIADDFWREGFVWHFPNYIYGLELTNQLNSERRNKSTVYFLRHCLLTEAGPYFINY
uniref:Uncharacterized protein n=1 Tax=Romanomermis culicivorax TaxID=13658 RepID=A0A915K5G8_ROMCU